MTRNLKALGLALIAAFAMSAVVVSAAQAEITFTGWEGTETNHVHTVLSSTQITTNWDAFTTTPGSARLTCTSITATGTSATGDEKTMTVQPHYDGCTFAASPIVVATTSCHFTYHANVRVTEHEYTGTYDVACTTPGDAIHRSIYNGANILCDFTIEEQSGINGITFTNKTDKAKKYLELDINSTNIKMKTTKGGILCGESTGATTSTGGYVGNDIITGKNTFGEEINVTISGS